MKQTQVSQSHVFFAARATAFAALCTFGMQPFVASAQATLPITPTSGATLGQSSNGTQTLNIVKPNAAGVSNNQFSQFNVGTAGLILNNATQAASTQIGGTVQANGALGGQSANTVLLQVNSGPASQLLGTTEIAGRGANVVLANPAGIDCSGCGFVNAPRVTLATGTAILGSNGALTGLDVRQGTINVDGKGLNASNSAVDLVARAMTINGQVQGNTIDAIAGANRVDYASKNAVAQAGTGDKPQVAIDVQALGGMYGNGAVRLVGTEAGVGVRDSGNLNSMTGSIDLSSNGDVTIGSAGRIKSGANATIMGSNVNNAGSIEAAGGASVRGNQAVANSGSVAGLAVDVSGQSLTNSGTLAATRELRVGGENVTLQGGEVRSGGMLTLNGPRVQVLGGTVSAADALTVNVGSLDNRATLSSGGDAQISAQQVKNAGTVTAQRSITVGGWGSSVDNSGGKLEAKQGAVNVQGDNFVNNGGNVTASQMLTVDSQNVDNTKGTLSSGMVRITSMRDVNNTNGSIVATNSANVKAQGALNNAGGTIKSANAMQLSSSSLDNRGGAVTTDKGAMSVQSGEILNGNGGRIDSGDMLTVQAFRLNNDAGTLAAARDVRIDIGGALSNRGGSITSGSTVYGTAGSLDNEKGVISAPNGANIVDLSNPYGRQPANNGNSGASNLPANNGNSGASNAPANNGNSGASNAPANNGNSGASNVPANNGNSGASNVPVAPGYSTASGALTYYGDSTPPMGYAPSTQPQGYPVAGAVGVVSR